MKVCYNCRIEKLHERFHKDSTKPDGYYSICKGCRRKRTGVEEHIPAKVIGEYKGSKIIIGHPYPYIRGTRIRAHRYIVETEMGRKLRIDEHVHHVDGNKLNFSLGNLVVLTKSDHHKQHPTPKGEGKYAECIGCRKKKWLNTSELKHRYGDKPARYKLYTCKGCGGSGRKKK